MDEKSLRPGDVSQSPGEPSWVPAGEGFVSMLSHLRLKNRTIVSRWKIDYAKLNKHRFLARVQMSLHHCAKASARGDQARLLGREG